MKIPFLTGYAETTCHFLLHCQYFITHRKILYDTINSIPRKYNTPFLVDKLIVYLLLYGDENFKFNENQNILKATIKFIRDTSRFSQI